MMWPQKIRGLKQTVAPVIEPVSLTNLKLHCRVESSSEDDLVTLYGKAAREYCESRIGMQCNTATWQLTLDRFSYNYEITLPLIPVSAVNFVKYVSETNVLTTLDPSLYEVDLASEPARIGFTYGNIWPYTRPGMSKVTIEFVAGYTSSTLIPAAVQQAILLLTAHWYENRIQVSDIQMYQVPMAVDALLDSVWSGIWM